MYQCACFPHLHPNGKLSDIPKFANLVIEKWFIGVVLICIFLIISEAEPLVTCFRIICIFFSELYNNLPLFLLGYESFVIYLNVFFTHQRHYPFVCMVSFKNKFLNKLLLDRNEMFFAGPIVFCASLQGPARAKSRCAM